MVLRWLRASVGKEMQSGCQLYTAGRGPIFKAHRRRSALVRASRSGPVGRPPLEILRRRTLRLLGSLKCRAVNGAKYLPPET
mgnify:FL=1